MGKFKIERPVYFHSWASVVGRLEREGPLGEAFDEWDATDRFGAETWEKAEGELCHRVLGLAMEKGGIGPEEVSAVFGGDLQNQCVATAHGVLPYGIPFAGLYGACSTCTEGLLLAALTLAAVSGFPRVAAVTTSHNCAAERQFRTPLEYGGQRAPTAQWTATAGGAFVLGRVGRIRISAGMVGRMIDGGIRDAGNMGAAMAPAAADSLLRWFADGEAVSSYDAIVTGDLGREGSRHLAELLEERGLSLEGRHRDCGCLLYDENTQDAHAGASGCGCSASVLAAHFLPALQRGEMKRLLFLSTGALMSPSSVQQGENIFGVAPIIQLQIQG